MFFSERALNISLFMFFASYFTNLLLLLAFARQRTSKSSTFEKASKSSHFRSDNQRQISLDLSHTCRIRKRLISLINSATFFEIIRLARCEYSKLDVCTISLHLQSFSKRSREDVILFEEDCAYIRREMCLYSKKFARITTLYI
jgi:hypothetical protein